MIKVLYCGKELRQRRRETILNPPAGVEYETPVSLKEMKPDYKISKTPSAGNLNFLKILMQKMISFLKVPNIRHLSPRYLKKIDIVHTPGHLLLNKKPYVIEIDNPLCLSFYNLDVFLKRKWLIKKMLLSSYCKKLICISEAAKKSMAVYFPEKEIMRKCEVVYPYVKINPYKKNRNDGKIVLLSCNTKFYMKGTREVLSAFETLNNKYPNRLELWIVSNAPEEYLKKYKKFGNIKFFEARFTKEELYRDFYSQCDIFVQPSYQDSFGLVYLELLASGKPVITTDIYAIPEMVIDGYNGFLIKSPLYMYNPDYSFKKEYFPIEAADTENDFYKLIDGKEVVTGLIKTSSILIENDKLRKQMSERAFELANSKFSEEQRKNKLLEIYSDRI